MTFDEACEAYMESKSMRLRETTLEGYASAIAKHVLPAWGRREVGSVRHAEVQRWVDSIEGAGAASKAFKTFRQVLRWAERELQLDAPDPTRGIELPKRAGRRAERLSPAEERSALRACAGEPWEAVALCAAALGLRPSEACGLDWSDVDWRSGWVHVQRGAHSVHGGRTVELPCKTPLSRRWVKLPGWALARLREIRGRRRAGRMRGELSPRAIACRLKRMLRRIGLGRASIGCLRHSWATMAVEAGAAIADVAVALGHTSVETCRRHYIMSTRAVVRRAGDAYSRAMLCEP